MEKSTRSQRYDILAEILAEYNANGIENATAMKALAKAYIGTHANKFNESPSADFLVSARASGMMAVLMKERYPVKIHPASDECFKIHEQANSIMWSVYRLYVGY